MSTPHASDLSDAELKRLACLDKHDGYCASVCVKADDGRAYSFASAHFLDGIHEANVASEGDAPPERLVLRFTTGEVVVLGSRLERVEDALSEGHLRGLKTINPRYAAFLKTGPLVLSITVNRKSDV
jgi:hypothetical protein